MLFFLGSETGAGAELSVAGQRGRSVVHFIPFHPRGIGERPGELCLLRRQEGGSKKMVSELQPPPQLQGPGKALEWWLQGERSRDGSDCSRNPRCNPLGHASFQE